MPEIYQARVKQWMVECFGEEITQNPTERAYRFLEEALELVQSLNISKEDVTRLTDYTYGRPIGDTKIEIGQTTLVLAALAETCNVNMDDQKWKELESAWNRIDKIREKWKSKTARAPLPSTRIDFSPIDEEKFSEGFGDDQC